MVHQAILATILGSFAIVHAQQWPTASQPDASSAYEFQDKIERVAVIGAGPTGLLHASTLLEHGFQVRLFERAPKPGGQWLYTDKTPVDVSYPNRPIEVAGYVPDIPDTLPLTRYYKDGDDGLGVDWRIREHWNPSSVWAGMTSTLPPYMMSLPNIQYPPDTPWSMPNRLLQKHVRQYASSTGLNSNDEENANVTSYSTRVERVQKLPGAKQWTLTLRKIATEPESDGRLRVDWWKEQFDGVVVASVAENDSPWVPPIPGLKEWAEAYPHEIYHSRNYRRPDSLAGKKVLIVGGSVSAAGIAKDLLPLASSVSLSIRNHSLDDPIKLAISNLIPTNATVVPEIEMFSRVLRNDGKGVRGASILLVNGTVLRDFDHIILATGYRTSFPFLYGLHNSTMTGPDEPEAEVAPIITNGMYTRSLHWTGHYIPDPTLALASVDPWDLGPYQALGFAKVWSRKARLPSTASMWKTYPRTGHDGYTPALGVLYMRLFVNWLNDASLEFGGRLVSPLYQDLQAADYFAFRMYKFEIGLADIWSQLENTPRSQWPIRSEPETLKASSDTPTTHWAELTNRW